MNFVTFTKLGRTLLLALVLSVWIGCSGGGELVGRWENVNDGATYELFKDRTGVMTNRYGTNFKIRWGVEGRRFVVYFDDMTRVGDYTVTGNKLSWTLKDGSSYLYVKKK